MGSPLEYGRLGGRGPHSGVGGSAMSVISRLSALAGLGRGTVVVLLGVLAILTAATLVRGLALSAREGAPPARRRWRSLITWWILYAGFVTTVILGPLAVTVVMAILSLFLAREVLGLGSTRGLDPAVAGATLLIYAWAYLSPSSFFLLGAPSLAGLLALGGWVGRAPMGPRRERLASVARALVIAVIGPSFVVGVALLSAPEAHPEAGMGWLVLLGLLTELNDSAQAWWGKAVGAHALAPRTSPSKTWEGFFGGVATTVVAATTVAPLLTSYGRGVPPGGAPGAPPWVWSVLAGLLIAVAGTAGDLTASSEKRRTGVKDSGRVLPGHGGLLDRFDSLSAAAPAFYLLTRVLWGG